MPGVVDRSKSKVLARSVGVDGFVPSNLTVDEPRAPGLSD